MTPAVDVGLLFLWVVAFIAALAAVCVLCQPSK
jgi:hypothetical protein